jgi:hypothetical protein
MIATYGDGSKVYGAVKTESISIGGYTASAPAAISYYQSQSFASFNGDTHMDGLWGMAYSTFNGGQPTVLDRLVSQTSMDNIFSMCFSNNGGYLVLGGIDTSLHTGSLQYTAITSFDYYGFAINDISISGTELDVTFPKTILDSGTTFSYIPNTIYTKIKGALRNAGMNSGFFMSPDQPIPCAIQATINTMPNIVFVLPKVGGSTFTLTLSPSQYTIPCDDPGFRAFGFIPVADGEMAIIGDTFMHAFHSVFDREHNQIGFAPVSSNCDGFIELNSQVKTVPGTKSQFNDVATFLPSAGIIVISLALFIFLN